VLTTYDVAASQATDASASYEPDYFSQFQPNTARDMVARIPGFALEGGEGGERGFGQASLNILINGRRPSSKSSGAGEILGRIPNSPEAGNIVPVLKKVLNPSYLKASFQLAGLAEIWNMLLVLI